MRKSDLSVQDLQSTIRLAESANLGHSDQIPSSIPQCSNGFYLEYPNFTCYKLISCFADLVSRCLTSFPFIIHLGQYYTDDQFMNIFSFSMLYKWIHHVHQTMTAAEEKPDVARLVFGNLANKSLDYCFRILDQCERSGWQLLYIVCFKVSYIFYITVNRLFPRSSNG